MDAHSVEVTIGQEAAEFMVQEAKSWHPCETGGVLVGHIHNGNFLVELAVGPGPNAQHKRAFFRRNQEYAERQVEEAFEKSKGRHDYLGEWHSHGRRQGPSTTDIISMMQIRDEVSNNCSRPLLIIVMQHRGSWAFYAYIPDSNALKEIYAEVEE